MASSFSCFNLIKDTSFSFPELLLYLALSSLLTKAHSELLNLIEYLIPSDLHFSCNTLPNKSKPLGHFLKPSGLKIASFFLFLIFKLLFNFLLISLTSSSFVLNIYVNIGSTSK